MQTQVEIQPIILGRVMETQEEIVIRVIPTIHHHHLLLVKMAEYEDRNQLQSAHPLQDSVLPEQLVTSFRV